MQAFLRAAQCVAHKVHGHLALRSVAGCNSPAFAHVPPPAPMCHDSFARVSGGGSRDGSSGGAQLGSEAAAHARHIEAYLLQCAAHANEEYLVRRRLPDLDTTWHIVALLSPGKPFAPAVHKLRSLPCHHSESQNATTVGMLCAPSCVNSQPPSPDTITTSYVWRATTAALAQQACMQIGSVRAIEGRDGVRTAHTLAVFNAGSALHAALLAAGLQRLPRAGGFALVSADDAGGSGLRFHIIALLATDLAPCDPHSLLMPPNKELCTFAVDV